MEYLSEQNSNLSSYSDYLKACTYLGLDMALPKNRYPHNFRHWHDIRTDEYRTAKALKDEEDRKKLYEKFTDVCRKIFTVTKIQRRYFYYRNCKKSARPCTRRGHTPSLRRTNELRPTIYTGRKFNILYTERKRTGYTVCNSRIFNQKQKGSTMLRRIRP